MQTVAMSFTIPRQFSCCRSRPQNFLVLYHIRTVITVLHEIQIFVLFLTTSGQVSCCSSPLPGSCPVLNHIPISSCAHPAYFQRVPTVMPSGCEFNHSPVSSAKFRFPEALFPLCLCTFIKLCLSTVYLTKLFVESS